MAYQKKTDDNVKWYATEILSASGEDHLVWQLEEFTGWINYTRVCRVIEKWAFVDEPD
jgi:hypothetical protein